MIWNNLCGAEAVYAVLSAVLYTRINTVIMISLEDFIVESKNLSALEDYINKVYAIVLLSVPGACQAAGALYTLEKIIGLLPMVRWLLLIGFDMTCLLYLGSGIFFVKTGYRKHMVLQT